MKLPFFSKFSSKAKVDDSNKPRQPRHTKSRSSSTSMYDPSEPARILNALSPNLPPTPQSIPSSAYRPSRSQSLRHTASISRFEPHYARSRTPSSSAPIAYHPRPHSTPEMISNRRSGICQSPADSEADGVISQPYITRPMPLPRPPSIDFNQIMSRPYLLRSTPLSHPPSVKTNRSQSSYPSSESSDNKHPSQECRMTSSGGTNKIPKLLTTLQPLSLPPRAPSVPTIPEDPRPASTSPILSSQRISSVADIPYISLKGKERATAPLPTISKQPHYALRRTSMFEQATDFSFDGKTLPQVDLLSPITLSTSPNFETDPDDDEADSSPPTYESLPIDFGEDSCSDDDEPIVSRSSMAVPEDDEPYGPASLEPGEEANRQELQVEVTESQVVVGEECAGAGVGVSQQGHMLEEELRPSRQETESNSACQEHRMSHSPRTKEDRKPLWEAPPPVESPFVDVTVSIQESFLALPDVDDRGVVRKERNQGWSGEWNRPHIRDVIEKLRELR